MRTRITHLAYAVLGALLLAAGVALLVLPGPGLLLVLAGMVLLATAFPSLERHVEPVRRLAMKAAEDSVSSPLRVAGSLLTGAALVAAGVVWSVLPRLPFGGWPTGSSLVLSGVVIFALLVYSHRRVRRTREHRPPGPGGEGAGPPAGLPEAWRR